MRLKDVCNINSLMLSEQTSPNYKFRYIDISNVDCDGNVVLSEEMCFRDAPSRARRIVKEGDTIISTVRTYLKAIATVNFPVEDVIVSTGFAVCSPNYNVHSNYIAYSFRTDRFIDEVCKKSTGVSYPAITASALSAIEIPYCDELMQSQIVSFLDTKTAALDKRIAVLEKKQDVYSRLRKSIINRAVTRGLTPDVPLKDSGVDWIGLIPEHWEVRRMKESILSLESGKRPANDKEEVLSIGGEHIQNGNFSLNHPMYVSEQTYMNSQGKIKLGDTLIVKDGATIGKCMYVSEMPSDRMLLNEHVYRVEGEKYLYWLINSSHSQYWFRSMNMSSAQESIKQITMHNLPVPLPPLPEQRAIASYLDEKCAKIDAAVENIGKQVDALKRLKRALINEVVTGKRKV